MAPLFEVTWQIPTTIVAVILSTFVSLLAMCACIKSKTKNYKTERYPVTIISARNSVPDDATLKERYPVANVAHAADSNHVTAESSSSVRRKVGDEEEEPSDKEDHPYAEIGSSARRNPGSGADAVDAANGPSRSSLVPQFPLSVRNNGGGHLLEHQDGVDHPVPIPPRRPLLTAASAISGRTPASSEIPYMTPPLGNSMRATPPLGNSMRALPPVTQTGCPPGASPTASSLPGLPSEPGMGSGAGPTGGESGEQTQHFSGDSSESSKGYTHINVRQPLRELRAHLNTNAVSLNPAASLQRGDTGEDSEDALYAAISGGSASDYYYATIGDSSAGGGASASVAPSHWSPSAGGGVPASVLPSHSSAGGTTPETASLNVSSTSTTIHGLLNLSMEGAGSPPLAPPTGERAALNLSTSSAGSQDRVSVSRRDSPLPPTPSPSVKRRSLKDGIADLYARVNKGNSASNLHRRNLSNGLAPPSSPPPSSSASPIGGSVLSPRFAGPPSGTSVVTIGPPDYESIPWENRFGSSHSSSRVGLPVPPVSSHNSADDSSDPGYESVTAGGSGVAGPAHRRKKDPLYEVVPPRSVRAKMAAQETKDREEHYETIEQDFRLRPPVAVSSPRIPGGNRDVDGYEVIGGRVGGDGASVLSPAAAQAAILKPPIPTSRDVDGYEVLPEQRIRRLDRDGYEVVGAPHVPVLAPKTGPNGGSHVGYERIRRERGDGNSDVSSASSESEGETYEKVHGVGEDADGYQTLRDAAHNGYQTLEEEGGYQTLREAAHAYQTLEKEEEDDMYEKMGSTSDGYQRIDPEEPPQDFPEYQTIPPKAQRMKLALEARQPPQERQDNLLGRQLNATANLQDRQEAASDPEDGYETVDLADDESRERNGDEEKPEEPRSLQFQEGRFTISTVSPTSGPRSNPSSLTPGAKPSPVRSSGIPRPIRPATPMTTKPQTNSGTLSPLHPSPTPTAVPLYAEVRKKR